MKKADKKYDVFISHASEDKSNFVRPLAEALTNIGYRVWYDEFTMSVGDGLRRSIDIGISNSRYGIVVLSKAFFNKGWTNYELDGLTQVDLSTTNEGAILPIWYNINYQDVYTYSTSLANKLAISSDGTNINHVIKELEKKLGDFAYTVENGKIIKSKNKVCIDSKKRDRGFQLIKNSSNFRLFNKEKCVVTSDCVIYPYSKEFKALKFNHWQQNKGEIKLIRHVAYDSESEYMINSSSEVLKNDGCNFVSEVKFDRMTEGPIRIVCEISTTHLFKSLFEEGSDEIENYHRIRIEFNSFSIFLPNLNEFLGVKAYVNGVESEFKPVPGGRLMKHEIHGTTTPLTIYSFTYEKSK